jgi:hypothetical protein
MKELVRAALRWIRVRLAKLGLYRRRKRRRSPTPGIDERVFFQALPASVPYELVRDDEFRVEAKAFVERVWEMRLACTLLEHGYPLEKPPPEGAPDVLCPLDEGRVW